MFIVTLSPLSRCQINGNRQFMSWTIKYKLFYLNGLFSCSPFRIYYPFFKTRHDFFFVGFYRASSVVRTMILTSKRAVVCRLIWLWDGQNSRWQSSLATKKDQNTNSLTIFKQKINSLSKERSFLPKTYQYSVSTQNEECWITKTNLVKQNTSNWRTNKS